MSSIFHNFPLASKALVSISFRWSLPSRSLVRLLPLSLFIHILFSLRLVDLLASSRVCCGVLPGCMRVSENRGPGRNDRYLDRATTAESVHWPLFFVSSLVTVHENFYVIKTSSADRSGAIVK